MKLFYMLSHPYTLMLCYSCILISGEHWGGFYIFYILLALPHGGVHALLALAGFIVLLAGRREGHPNRLMIINPAGLCLLLASLIVFFVQDRGGYNKGTFEQAMPLASLALTALVALCFLVRSFYNAGRAAL